MYEDQEAAIEQVAVSPDTFQKMIQREYVNRLSRAEADLESAMKWSVIHPVTTAESLKELGKAMEQITLARKEISRDIPTSIPTEGGN